MVSLGEDVLFGEWNAGCERVGNTEVSENYTARGSRRHPRRECRQVKHSLGTKGDLAARCARRLGYEKDVG